MKYRIENLRNFAILPISWSGRQGYPNLVFWGAGPIQLDSSTWESTGATKDNSISLPDSSVITSAPVLRVSAVAAEAAANGWRVNDFAYPVMILFYNPGTYEAQNSIGKQLGIDPNVYRSNLSYNGGIVAVFKVIPINGSSTGATANQSQAGTYSANQAPVYVNPPGSTPIVIQQGTPQVQQPVIIPAQPTPQVDLMSLIALQNAADERASAREERAYLRQLEMEREERKEERRARESNDLIRANLAMNDKAALDRFDKSYQEDDDEEDLY